MITKLTLTLLLLLSSLTQLSAQTGKCYTSEELRLIANKMVEANTNAKLNTILNKQLAEQRVALTAKDSAISAQDSVLASRELVISLKEEIIAGKDNEIADLRLQNKKYARKNKWLKIKWAGTTIGLTGALIFVTLK